MERILVALMAVVMVGCGGSGGGGSDGSAPSNQQLIGAWQGPVGGGAPNYCQSVGGVWSCDIPYASPPMGCSGLSLMGAFSINDSINANFSGAGGVQTYVFANGVVTGSTGYSFQFEFLPGTSNRQAVVTFAPGCSRQYFWAAL